MINPKLLCNKHSLLDDINVINNTNIYGYLYNNKILKIS